MTRRKIPVSHPVLAGNEKKYVNECLDSTWISSAGRFITEFEEAFAHFCGVPHAIATNNGTTALHAALLALGIGPGDEVIVPTLTYVASANAIQYCRATPVFVDSEAQTMNMDPPLSRLRSLRILARSWLYISTAILLIWIRSMPLRSGTVSMSSKMLPKLLGAHYKGRSAGSLGDVSTFSFFGNKTITTGEGGMVTAHDPDVAAKVRILRDRAWTLTGVIGFQ